MSSLTLLTDLYELTMAYGYWKLGLSEREAVFHLYYRKQPFGNGFVVAAGLASVIDFLINFKFDASDLKYLASLSLFDDAFLDYLSKLEFSCDVDAIPEGTLVFPHEPLIRIQGPLLQAQILETILLNLINYSSLVATKAARLRVVAPEDEIYDFGLRRAQGPDGGMTAARSAYIGGVDGTSNVLAGKEFNIPVRGTHAHSWVMVFDDEKTAFEKYAEVLPDHCVFLLDTYDTLEALNHAIGVGCKLLGVRLDSGDLLGLSRQVRARLDAAGYTETKIVASNELDEYKIHALKAKGAPIDTWGVGTRLVTAYDDPALGGVYKLGAIQDGQGQWHHRMKYAGIMEKASIPGILQVRRHGTQGDTIYDSLLDSPKQPGQDLLVPIFRKGKKVYSSPSLSDIRAFVLGQLKQFPDSITRHEDPGTYRVDFEGSLSSLMEKLCAH